MRTTTDCNAKGLAVSQVRTVARNSELNSKKNAVCTAVALIISAALATAEAREVSPRAKVSFDIDAPSLVQALMQFTEQSGLQLMIPIHNGTEAPAPRVVGSYTPRAALEQLLAGTMFEYDFANSRTVAIRLAQSASSGDGGETSANDSAPSAGAYASTQMPTVASAAETSGDAPKKAIPEILVKGSRTMNVDVVRSEDDVQPYTIFDARQIAQSGASTTEEFLKQQLTMNTTVQSNAQAYSSNNGTVSSINLRGLGAGETLILIDGRRSASVNLNQFINSGGSQPDINGIPLAAIERIEVLPSSASAIYGGAAMGGVVNIVLKRQFDGGSVSYTYDSPIDGNAPIRTVNASYGFKLDRTDTRVFIGGQYSDAEPLRLRDRRDFIESNTAEILHNGSSYLYSAGSPFPGAATNISSAPTFDFTNFPACSQGPDGFSGCLLTPNLTLRDGTALGSPITSISTGVAPGADPASALKANAGAYNLNLSSGTGVYGLGSVFGTAARTKAAFATLRQPLFSDVELFAEASTNTNEGRTLHNPIPENVYSISALSPINPFNEDIFISIPSTEDAMQRSRSVTRAATVGLLMPLAWGWTSEIDYTWSRNSFRFDSQAVDILSLSAAMEVGDINPFVDVLAYPLELGGFLAPQGYSGASTLNDLTIRASGEVGQLPGGSPTLTIGLGHRREGTDDAHYLQQYPLTPEETVEGIFFGRSQSTSSIYLEANIPIVGDQNRVPGVRSLNFQLAGRSERYKVFNGTAFQYLSPAAYEAQNPPQGVRETSSYTSTNPTIGFKYSPISDVSLRASYARAFLPPTASQLLENPTPQCGFPCVPVSDPQTGLSYQVDVRAGGNSAIRPQTARSWDIGIIWEPGQGAMRGLRVNLEYYRITQPNYIVVPTVQQVVSDASLSARVTRDPITGLVTLVDTSFLNASEYKTSGWDLKVAYTRATGMGSFSVRVAGTFIDHDLRQFAIDSPFVEYAAYPNDGGEVRIKANGTLQWDWRDWTAAWTTTYYSGYRQAYTPGSPSALRNPSFTSPVVAAQGNWSIPSQIFHDFFLTYEFGNATSSAALANRILSNTSVQIGVNNVFNTVPEFDAFNRPYYYSTFGDPRLRTYRLAVRRTF